MQRLTDAQSIAEARASLASLLEERAEWFCTEEAPGDARPTGAKGRGAIGQSSATFAVGVGEWELQAAHASLLLSLLTDRGTRTWRVVAWEWTGERLLLEVRRRMGAERALLAFIPRARVSETLSAVSAARRAACQRLAERLREMLGARARIQSAALSRGARRGEAGRHARIILLDPSGRRVAVSAPIAPGKADETDAFVASTLVWFRTLAAKSRKAQPTRLCLVASPADASRVAERLALFNDEVRARLSLYEDNPAVCASAGDASAGDASAGNAAVGDKDAVDANSSETNANSSDTDASSSETDASSFGRQAIWARVEANAPALKPCVVPTLDELLAQPATFHRRTPSLASESARRLAALAPGAIDVVSGRGTNETLRFHGLAFARVRRWLGHERVWFGVEGAGRRQLLGEENWPQLCRLIEELSQHRQAHNASRRHAFYRAAPEAWLESLLRRDISQLDPGLRLAPLHAQFRTSPTRSDASAGRPLDLLALRRDGRLVVIELKVSEDVALPVQAADYWRRIATAHRAGLIRRARLFGDAELSPEPPLVYLVAPLLSFHRTLTMLAADINPRISIYRFDLNEDWRTRISVARRERIN